MSGLREMELYGRRVLLRVDFNVPINGNGEIIDDSRIKASLPTLEYLVQKGAKVIVVSHLGRPNGKRENRYRMDKVAERLGQLMNKVVPKAPDCVGQEVRKMVESMKPGDVIMLENVRFHPGEEKNDPEFCRELASLADIYVNDAFGTAHRAHASTAGVADYLPSAPGFLLEKEVLMLTKVLNGAERPRVAIVGGAKVSDKLALLTNLLGKMDVIIIGGGMANTFLKACGYNIGSSLCEDSLLHTAREFMEKAAQRRVKLLMPKDVVIADRFSADSNRKVVAVNEVPDGWMILDIGPETAKVYRKQIIEARTVFWNGPMGVYELEPFTAGTDEIAKAVAETSAITVVGGGDSSAVIFNLGLEDKITHISTGGGATLEFLEGRKLPGLVSCRCQKMVG